MSAEAVPSVMDQRTYDSLIRNLRDAGMTPEEARDELSWITVVPADDPAIESFPAPSPGAVA